MSKLLINEHPLMVLPTLAVKVGLNEAIILQQIHYWISINRETGNNYRDGHYWTYNSYDEWAKQFPFWSARTIQRAIRKLEGFKVLVSGNYNKLPIDRTKWYRIDYEALALLEVSPLGQNGTLDMTERSNRGATLSPPLPESTTETTSKTNNYNEKGADLCQRTYDEEIKSVIIDYLNTYRSFMGKDHPVLRRGQWERVAEEIAVFDGEYSPDWGAMIDRHFERGMETDYNINHFATAGVLTNILYEIGL